MASARRIWAFPVGPRCSVLRTSGWQGFLRQDHSRSRNRAIGLCGIAYEWDRLDEAMECPQAAVGYVRDLLTSGVILPDAPSSNDARGNCVGKKFAVGVEGFGNSWNDFSLRGLNQNRPTNFDLPI